MDIKDALKSIIKPHEGDRLAPLSTVWGERLDKNSVLSEYPRPQLKRESFLCLNGLWDYAFTTTKTLPEAFDGRILVPFSPECSLSGVNRQLLPSEFLWYRTFLPDLELTSGKRAILHFGAIDYHAGIYINRQPVTSHKGGYLPFCIDITDFLTDGKNELLIKVKDPSDEGCQPRGKQTLHRGGIFYTAQSGIWQTVWIELVPTVYLENLWFETDYDTGMVTAHMAVCNKNNGQYTSPLKISLSVICSGSEILTSSLPLSSASVLESGEVSTKNSESNPLPEILTSRKQVTLSFTIPQEHFHPWSPDDPFLYQVRLSLGSDKVQSYFALRHYSIEKREDGIPVFCLNHHSCFLMGVLDQGYWPDGLYTAPSDEALIYDITAMKALGFNMLRKHIKVESARWYYHCDRLGMIVCQDMVNGGSKYRMPVINYLPTLFPKLSLKDSNYALFSRKDKSARKQWEKECLETIEHLRFFPSIAIWVPFNEGWGQFDAARITDMIRKKDPSRLIDSASGWFDQSCGDFISIHNYFRPLSVTEKKWSSRAFFLSEYGGFACHIKNHSSVERVFGYKRFDSLEEFSRAYREFIEKSLLPLRQQGLCGAVYTQVSDVEEEVNGLLTYDRKVNKLV